MGRSRSIRLVTLALILNAPFLACAPLLAAVVVIGTLVGTVYSGAGILSGYESLIISSTGLLIVVGVVLDTMKQIEAQLMMRNYEGFIR